MKRVAVPVALCAAIIVGLSGCIVSVSPPRIITETLAVSPDSTLRVENSVGSISIIGTERDDIDVTMTVAQASFGLFAGYVTPLESVQLDADYSDGVLLRHTPFDARGISVSYEILAPSLMRIGSVTSSTGSIHVEDLAGDPLLTTSTGSITADGISGTVTAITSTGSITVTNSAAVAALETSTGSITAEIRNLPAGTEPIPIDSSTGSIAIAIDTTLPLTIRAETGTGSINVHPDLDLAVRWYDDDSLEADLNGGGTVLDIEAGTGSVSLYPLPVD